MARHVRAAATKKSVTSMASTAQPAGRSTVAQTAGAPATVEEVRLHAYLKWLVAGKPEGDGRNFWLEAERELRKAV